MSKNGWAPSEVNPTAWALRVDGFNRVIIHGSWRRTGVARVTTPSTYRYEDLQLPQEIVDAGDVEAAKEFAAAYIALTYGLEE